MDAEFWLDRWAEGRTGWQQAAPDALVLRHFGALGLRPGARVLVPLCGATPDIGWLLGQGFAVVGAELSGLAIGQLFEGLGVAAEVTALGPLRRHSAPGLDVFEGDIFDLTAEHVGPIHAILDRAALFALPPDLRPRYAAHLVALTAAAPQLLICLEHGSDRGPPFSVTAEEVARLYGDAYDLTLREARETGFYPTRSAARESLYLLARAAG